MRASACEIMRSPFPRWPLVRLFALVVVFLFPGAAFAQDDPPSLGDLARNLRHSKAQQPQPQSETTGTHTVPAHTVIDNENLAQVMDDAKNAKPIKEDKTVFSIDPSGNTLKVSSPDVTCSLSFNAQASALLVRPVLIEDLPLAELLKLDGVGHSRSYDWPDAGTQARRRCRSGRASACDSRRRRHGATQRRAAFRRDPPLSPQGGGQALQHNCVPRKYRNHPWPR